MKWFSTQSDNMRAAVSILILALIQNSDATFFHQFTFSSGFWSNRIFQSVQWGKTNLECASICSIITEVITNLNLFFYFYFGTIIDHIFQCEFYICDKTLQRCHLGKFSLSASLTTIENVHNAMGGVRKSKIHQEKYK